MSSWDRITPYEVSPAVQFGLDVIGAMVRDGRLRGGLSQRQLAARTGLNQSTISRLENGLLRTFGLVRLARVFAVLTDPLHVDARPLSPWR